MWWIKILYLVLEIWALKAKANHPHHHHHGGEHHDGHHGHHHHHQMSDDLTENLSRSSPIVSSFSHKLPGTGSFMSVTRYFNTNVKDHNHSNHADHAPEQERTRVINAQGDQFHPWNPRFQVGFYHYEH